ncbi:MAG: glycine--tRNA ligase subunit beta, partial [Legionella sp.]
YEQQLKDAYVIADFAQRKAAIKQQIEQLATPLNATVIMPEQLLDEVTSIVEWPQALIAGFDPEFLDVPAEALIASMQSHQKCFALKDATGKLMPYFITVSNIASTNPQQVIMGNEKVMRARLSDAAFFFRQDKKQVLSGHIAATKNIVFQTKLGSVHDKVSRVDALVAYLTPSLGLDEAQAARAVALSKCDLLSGMVGEFPELQGLMGYYYALNDGEHEQVARALDEQYMPRFAADELPASSLGLALSLADRLDSLVGIFAIGQKPSGVKDPFKLRRHALAMVRMLIHTAAELKLTDLITQASSAYDSALIQDKSTLAELKPFMLERLNSFYLAQDIRIDLILAVRARQDEWLYDFDKRLKALTSFVGLPAAASLSAACKRVNNLLSHAESISELPALNESLLSAGAEQALYQHLSQLRQTVEPLYQRGDYSAILTLLAELKEPVDAFFDHVMVMVDDEQLKQNRLALLVQLRDLLQGVADISMLQLS